MERLLHSLPHHGKQAPKNPYEFPPVRQWLGQREVDRLRDIASSMEQVQSEINILKKNYPTNDSII